MESKTNPNILFITIDSLRFDRVYGKDHSAKTPNIELLMKNGVSFSQTISSSDATGTSIGSIFTGCFPFRTGITHFTFNSNIPLFTDELKNKNFFWVAHFLMLLFFLNYLQNLISKISMCMIKEKIGYN